MARHYRWSMVLVIWWGILVGACTPPTPPPSPTPWPSATPEGNLAQAAPPTETVPPPALAPSATPSSTPRAPLLPTATPPLITLTVWENLPPAQFQQLQQDIEVFQQQFPYYHLDVQHYPSPESFMTAVMSGQSNFEVVLASPVLLGNLQDANQIAPMSNFFPTGFMDNFIAGPLTGATRDNNIWGLPETAGFHLLLFYNRAMIDTPPITTAELADMAQSFTAAPKWGLGLNSYDPLWLIPWLAAYGGSLTDETGQPTLNSPAMVQAIALLVEWHHTIAPIATYDEMQEGFSNGNGAMMINGDWALGELALTLNLDWGVAQLPMVSGGEEDRLPAPLVLGKYWAVSNTVTGERAQAASAFLDYVTRPERQLTWAAKFGQLPTRRETLNDPAIVNNPVMRTSIAQMQAGQTLPLGINPNALLEAMRTPLRGAIDGALTPEQAAQQMQENLAR